MTRVTQTRGMFGMPLGLALFAFGSYSPQEVAEEAVIALCNETRRSWLGWPEKLFVRLNGLLPALVDRALARQLPVIERHARRPAHPATDHGDNPTCATHEKEH